MVSNNQEQKFKNKTLVPIGFLIIAIGYFLFPRFIEAATLYFSPSSGSYLTDNIFSVDVLVDTQGTAINNAEATVNFPADFLSVVSLSQANSIFSLWVQQPTYSNGAGTIVFNGGLPTPGYGGAAGKIFSVVFRAKNTGLASLLFSSAAVRANDGYGTDILQNLGQASFNLTARGQAPPTVPEAPLAIGSPAAPKISSPTHPDPTKWYALSDAKFNWELPQGITATRLLVDNFSLSTPSVTYSPPIHSKELNNLDDGAWYFHARLENSRGWGEVAHFRFNIDTTPPRPFDVVVDDGGDPTNPTPALVFEAKDDPSGIAFYEIQIDAQEKITAPPTDIKRNRFVIKPQLSGDHVATVRAVDEAGNSVVSSKVFNVESLEPPVIVEYPITLLSDEALTIRGTSRYSKETIEVTLQKEDGKPQINTTKTEADGSWTYTHPESLKSGVYKIWAQVVDIRGARSISSNEITVAASLPPLLKLGRLIIDYLTVMLTFVLLIAALILLLFFVWYKTRSWKKRLQKEVREAEQELHESFEALKQSVQEQIKFLEQARNKRELTHEEERIIEQLRKDLSGAEGSIEKEIKDIEKELE